MTKFTIILEDGSLYKEVLVKIGKFYAKTNADIYWYLRENREIQIMNEKGDTPICIRKKEIYYFTSSNNYYQHK